MSKKSVKERIRTAGPTTKTVPVWLGADMDLVEQYEAAKAELEDVKPAKTLDGSGGKAEVEARIATLRKRLEEFRVDFRLRGLGDRRYERLVAEHPPRKTEDGSVNPKDNLGWDRTTFPAALVRAAVVEPELDDEDWRLLLGDDDQDGQLTGGQFDDLAAAAFKLSQHPIDVSF